MKITIYEMLLHLIVSRQEGATEVRADDDGVVCLQQGIGGACQEPTDHAILAQASWKLHIPGLGRERRQICRCLHHA